MPQFLTEDKVLELLKEVPGEQQSQFLDELINQYEIEGVNTEFSFGEMASNVPKDVWETAKGIYSFVRNPGQSVAALSSMARGGIRKLTGIEEIPLLSVGGMGLTAKATEKDQQLFEQFINDMVVKRYGTRERALQTIEDEPFQFIGDVLTVSGAIGQGLKIGTAGKIPQVAKVSQAMRMPVKTAIKYTGLDKIIKAKSNRFMAKASGMERAARKRIRQTKGVMEKPEEFMIRHGFGGSLEKQYKIAKDIEGKTVKVVDDLLASVTNKYKVKSVENFLAELRNAFGKNIDDVLTGYDEVIVKGKKKLVPFKMKEEVFVPMERMSKAFRDEFNEIQGLLAKSKKEGLTLSEINRVKRLGDDILNIYDRSGQVKAMRTAQNLSELRFEIKDFVEEAAKKHGIPDIQELNRQSQMSLLIKREIGDILDVTETRSALGDQIIFLLGLSGSAATAQAAPLLGSSIIVGGREVVRLPTVRAYIAKRLHHLRGKEFDELLRGVKTGNWTDNAKRIIRKERLMFQSVFPEMRVGGIIKEKYEQAG